MSKLIYLDNAATTKTAPEVVDAMLPYFSEFYGNPSSIYDFAQKSKEAVTKGRQQIADVLNAKKEEIYLSYPNYDEYVSREFAEKEKVIKDREVASTRCPVCHLPAKRKIRWFMNNSRAYESVSFCQKHGYIKGKVRIRHTDEDAFYAIKTLKRIDEEKAEEIREKRDSLRKKRQTKRQSEKFV